MNLLDENQNRRVIPRWRPFANAMESSELHDCSINPVISDDNDKNYERIKIEWESENSLESASEFISYAFVLNKLDEAIDAANYIVGLNRIIKPSVYRLAKSIVDSRLYTISPSTTDVKSSRLILPNKIGEQIHDLKQRLHAFPKNPILWADLSRVYAILGEDDKAQKAMAVAVGLGSGNRYIVRASARLSVHLHDPEKALYVIRTNSDFKYDPWLLASEISISCVAEKPSRNIKFAKKIIADNKFHPFHISELAGSLGTVELSYGSIKLAKKLFKKSLVEPNDNALAQAEWAFQRINGIDTSIRAIVPRSYEANARHSYRLGDWQSVLDNTFDWAWDEPFSSGPCSGGSFIASAIFDDHELALEFCEQGLRANPDDENLLNNKAFSLAMLNRIDEATKVLLQMPKITKVHELSVCMRATAGLISYRSGDVEYGRKMYQQAIDVATNEGHSDLAAMAQIYQAIEEARVDGSQADELKKKSIGLTEKSDCLVNKHLVNRLSNKRDKLILTPHPSDKLRRL